MCFSPFCLAQDSISEQGEIQQFVFSIDDAAEVVEQPQEEKQEKEFLEGYIEVKDEQEIKLEEPEDILLETDFSPTYRVNEIKKVSTYSKSLELPSSSDTLFGNDKFGISSNSYQYNDGNTLNKNVRQELGATVRNKYFSLIKADPRKYAPCMTATAGNLGAASICHWDNRKFTIPEIKRLTSIPDDYKLTGTYQQRAERLGRMVPPFMMKAVAENIYKNILQVVKNESA